MRWLYHLITPGSWSSGELHPASLGLEGFIHCSYRDEVQRSAELYFPAGAPLEVLQVDPRRLAVPLREDPSSRGPMPHVYGAIPEDAVRGRWSVAGIAEAPDAVRSTRVALVAFPGMTLLDLVGVWDPLRRISVMGFDPTHLCEVVGLQGTRVYCADGALVEVERVRPDLREFDLVVVPGGPGTRELQEDADVVAWLDGYPRNRLLATVCTGALLIGKTGRLSGLRATTHHKSLDELLHYGAEAVRERVVDTGQTVTAAGVTSGIDLGLHLVDRLMGAEVAARIAAQMEWSPRPIGPSAEPLK